MDPEDGWVLQAINRRSHVLKARRKVYKHLNRIVDSVQPNRAVPDVRVVATILAREADLSHSTCDMQY